MIKKSILGFAAVLLVFAAFVASRPGTFYYERSGVINSSAEKIYPYLNNFKLGGEWSPYEKMDPNMKKTFTGPEAGVGSRMEFEGNKDTGSGSLEILKTEENSLVEIKLIMTKPFYGENLIQYKLTPDSNGTLFNWSLSGEGGFLSKLMSVLIDCDKMMGDQFNRGIQNLKTLIESKV